MNSFEQTPLWLKTLAEREEDRFAVERETLRNAYRHFRDAGQLLAAELPAEMRNLTVHDISHIDALWDLASRIAGDNLIESVTPTEAFVFGGAAIVHDLGLTAAAYPNGFDELRGSDAHKTAYALALRQDPDLEAEEADRIALQQVLRLQHAEKAIALASEGWLHPDGEKRFLIESSALRSAYGWLIGRIGASHGWSHDQLAGEFHQGINQPAGYPAAWSVDPLKIACLLRLADAAHIDSSRAPSLLRAIREPQDSSSLHWAFQERLHGASVVEDRIRFSAGQPFDLPHASAWWLAYDVIRLVDNEFRGVDALLADLERPRFQVSGVLGAESPSRFAQSVPTHGWTPVNAQIHVGNVAALVERLGGAHLYGFNNTAALRELIQNAADAVRLRRVIEDRPVDWGTVTISVDRDQDGLFLEVEDSGTGMTDAVITNHLLNFGGSLWEAPDVGRLVPDFDPNFRPTGKFGIGFFSAFMLGDRVRVVTRPRTAGPDGTKVLEIDQLSKRPVLRQALNEERLAEPGTRVRVWLDETSQGARATTGVVEIVRWALSEPTATDLAKLCAYLCPALDVKLEAKIENTKVEALEASDWLLLGAQEMQERLLPPSLSTRPQIKDPEKESQRAIELVRLEKWMTLVEDSSGNVVGRAAIPAEDTPRVAAVVTIGGFRARTGEGLFGIFTGKNPTLARDSASLLATPDDLARWATEQAVRYAECEDRPGKNAYFAASVLSYGGDPGPLKLCRTPEKIWVDRRELAGLLTRCDSVELFEAHMMSMDSQNDDIEGDPEFSSNLPLAFINTETAFPPAWTESQHVGNVRACLQEVVRRAWGGVSISRKTAGSLLLMQPKR